MILSFVRMYRKELFVAEIICIAAYLIGGLLGPFLSIEYNLQAKLMHLLIGVACAYMFWHVLETRRSSNLVNPFWFTLACVWGASGLFFLRWILNWLHIDFFSAPDRFLYAAVPDWDGLLFGWHHHRHILFHSEIFPVLLLIGAIHWMKRWLRDFAVGLIIGVASHLVWDIIHGPFNSIRHLDYHFSALWMLGNAILAVFFAYYTLDRHAEQLDDAAL